MSAVCCLYFHPLAQYPGPFLARFSVWPSFYHTLNSNRHKWLWQLQEIYGRTGILFLGAALYIYIASVSLRECSLFRKHDAKVSMQSIKNVAYSLQVPSFDTGRMPSFFRHRRPFVRSTIRKPMSKKQSNIKHGRGTSQLRPHSPL